MSGSSTGEYVLGTGDHELQRLGFQHQVWSAQAFSLWERAGFGPGQTIIDVGCGPGYATFDLVDLVGPRGRVVAVDQSEPFLAHLRARAAALGVEQQIDVRKGDVETATRFAEGADGAYVRWVLCFVKDPEAVIAAIARSLRVGGTCAIQDYYFYRAISLGPPSDIFRRTIAAVDESFRRRGGDPDIGIRLPALFGRHGLEVVHAEPIVRAARPGSSLWQWPTWFFENYVPALVEMGLLTDADQHRFAEDWARHTADPNAIFVTPPVIDYVAVKR